MKHNILLYGDVDLRYVDGSAIWLLSMARVLAQTDSRVILLLKSARGDGGLFEDLARIPNLEIVDDFTTKTVRGPRYQPLMASRRIEQLVLREGIDFVLCRGLQVCTEVAQLPNAGPRLWAYMTDIPQTSSTMSAAITSTLIDIAAKASRILVQTEQAREFLEFHVATSRQKTVLLPPMIPTELRTIATQHQSAQTSSLEGPIRLVYAGKFAKMWNTLEMCELPTRAAEEGIAVELTMIGDKFQNDPDSPHWSDRMKSLIRNSHGVRWIGAMSRYDTLREIGTHDFGLAWRDSGLDTSHEISTKLLEYIACGVPPLVNRTAMHQNLLGADYPLFIDQSDIMSTIRTAYELRSRLKQLASTLTEVLAPYWIANRAEEFERILLSTPKIPKDHGPNNSIRLFSICCASRSDRLTRALGVNPDVVVHAVDQASLKRSGSLPSTNSVVVIDSIDDLESIPEKSSVWLYWHPALQNQPRPTTLKLDGLIVDGPNSYRPAAHWADLSIGAIHTLPFNQDLHARPKIQGSQHRVAVILQRMNGPEIARTYELLKLIRESDPQQSIHLYVDDTKIDSLSKWDQELVIDALEQLSVDPVTEGAWSLCDTTAPETWLRQVDYLVYSNEDTLPTSLRDASSINHTELIFLDRHADAESVTDAATYIVSESRRQYPRSAPTNVGGRSQMARPNSASARLVEAMRATSAPTLHLNNTGQNR